MSKTPTDQTSDIGLSVKGDTKKGQHITISKEDTLKKLFGTKHAEIADGLFRHCFKVLRADEATDQHPDHDERVFIVAAVFDIKPRDGVERLLAVQMAATHVAMVRAGRWMANADRLDQIQAHTNGYTKLARTYAAQMEALRKHRSGGQQTVTVQHVNVESGGQAIVGAVRKR